jgi:anti-sigma factor RsiW
MNTAPNMEERLWEYIDGMTSPAEKTVIERLLQEDAAWKTKYQELLQVNELLHSSGMEQPSMRFTRNVMEEIAKLHIAPAARTYINKKIIWGIGFFFIAILVGILIYGFGQMLMSPGEQSVVSKNFEKLDFSKFFNNNLVNALMMINLVIGLFLLDNYLSNKRKQYRKEA